MTKQTMTPPPEAGPGEAAARAQARRMTSWFAILLAIGGVIGMITALLEPHAASIMSGGTVPPLFAIAAAVVTAVATVIGTRYLYTIADELELHNNMVAGAVGANALLLGYPVWFLLWKGGVAPEPQHIILFLLVLITTGGTYLFRKIF